MPPPDMRYCTLGRTGLRVSRVGLGCGGPSRLGQSYGRSDDASKAVIFRALELGINFFDTAEGYGTESLLGQALSEAGAGDDVIVSTKKGVADWHTGALHDAAAMIAGLEASLVKLGRERVDVYHLHGLSLDHVDHALTEIVPALEKARDQGKIGHLAVSEAFLGDTSHRMLDRVLGHDAFDVMMVGFNLLNPSARHSVFPRTRELGVGTLIMFAVRRALSRPDRLAEVLSEMVARGTLLADLAERNPLASLGDVRDAAYRFCAHEPGADLVLTGTGSPDHLEDNVRSLLAEPLPADTLALLEGLFGHVDGVSGH